MESRATSSLPGPASDWEPNELPVPMPQAPLAPAIRYGVPGTLSICSGRWAWYVMMLVSPSKRPRNGRNGTIAKTRKPARA